MDGLLAFGVLFLFLGNMPGFLSLIAIFFRYPQVLIVLCFVLAWRWVISLLLVLPLILYGIAMLHSLLFLCPASLWLNMLTLLCHLF